MMAVNLMCVSLTAPSALLVVTERASLNSTSWSSTADRKYQVLKCWNNPRVEPSANRFCLRCCSTANDQINCNSHQDRAGCPTAIPGVYDFPDIGVSCSWAFRLLNYDALRFTSYRTFTYLMIYTTDRLFCLFFHKFWPHILHNFHNGCRFYSGRFYLLPCILQ